MDQSWLIQESLERSADSLVRVFRKIGADQRADKAVRAPS